MLRPFVQKLILALNLILLLIFLSSPPFIDNFNLYYQDFKVTTVNKLRNIVYLNKVFLIEIDDESLSRIPDKYPFSRRYLASVIQKLSDAKSKVIAIGDYIQAPSQLDPVQDQQLALSIIKAGNVVTRNQLLRFQNHRGQVKWQLTPPIPDIVKSANTLGFSRGIPNSSNNIRKWLLFHKYKDTIDESLVIKILKLYSKDNPNYEIEFIDEKYRFRNMDRVKFFSQEYSFDILNQIDINNYWPELNPFEKISFVDILEGKFDAQSIKDSIVIIGPTADGIDQPIQTSLGLKMSPIELETYVLSAMLQEKDSIQPPESAIQILFIFFFLISIWATYRLNPMTYLKCLSFFIPILFLCDLILFLLPSLKLHSHLPMHCLYLLSSALVLLAMNYFVERSEKSNIRHAFSHYVTSSVVNQILNQPEKLKLGGERKELSVFFSDIEGFASISEKMEIEKLVALLNQYLTEMTDNIIIQHNGMLDKYEGDAIMAIFGAPMDIKDHALKACLAAIDNQKLLINKLYPEWKKQNLPCFKVRIGINTGTMLVGNMGSKSRFDYTVIGDNVNVGSRLESLNKIYGTNILISETTRAHIGNQLIVRKLDRVIVRGKSLTMDIYELVGKCHEVTKTQIEFIQKYEMALSQYFDQNFTEALSLFEQASHTHLSHDKTCHIFIDRCKHFIRSGTPGESWDGVFRDKLQG